MSEQIDRDPSESPVSPFTSAATRPWRTVLVLAVALAALAGCAAAGAETGSPSDTAAGVDAADGSAAPAAQDGPAVIDAASTVELLAERADITVIDVRTPEEFDAGHLRGAELIDVSDPGFDAAIEALDRDGTYVLYCRSGNRSAVAAERMAAAGFAELYDAGAFVDLAAAGLPTGP